MCCDNGVFCREACYPSGTIYLSLVENIHQRFQAQFPENKVPHWNAECSAAVDSETLLKSGTEVKIGYSDHMSQRMICLLYTSRCV